MTTGNDWLSMTGSALWQLCDWLEMRPVGNELLSMISYRLTYGTNLKAMTRGYQQGPALCKDQLSMIYYRRYGTDRRLSMISRQRLF